MTPVVATAVDGLQLGLSPGALAAVLVGLLAASFVFSGTETAMFSLQKLERRRLAQANRTGRRIHALLSRRGQLITTILIGNETVNIALAATGAAAFGNLTEHAWLNPWLNIAIITPTLVLLSEITPKVLAFRFNTQWARVAVWPLTVFYHLVFIPRVMVNAMVSLLARAAKVRPRAVEDGMGEAELLDLLDQGTASGNVDERERELIENVLEFDQLILARVMTPRPDLFGLSISTPWDAILDHCRDQGFSRVPMYGSGPDDIRGTLLLKDLLKHRARPPRGPRQLESLLVPPTFVPQSKPAADMMREFLERRYHLAFVVDEHGTLVGIVTLDDLLEELFGDPSGTARDDSAEVEIGPDGAASIQAGIDLDDFAEATGIHLPEGDYHTVGGFLFHSIGRLPRRGDVVVHEGHRFVVRRMDRRRIAEITARLSRPQPEEAAS